MSKYPLLLIYTPIDKDNYIVYNGDRTAIGMSRYLEHMYLIYINYR